MQVLLKPFCTICKLHLPLCLQIYGWQMLLTHFSVDWQCWAVQGICVKCATFSADSCICWSPQRWWDPAISLPSVVENAARAGELGTHGQLPTEGWGRMTGCVCGVQCQESWEPLLTKCPELFVPEQSVFWGIGPSWEDSAISFIKPIQHFCLIWGPFEVYFSLIYSYFKPFILKQDCISRCCARSGWPCHAEQPQGSHKLKKHKIPKPQRWPHPPALQ